MDNSESDEEMDLSEFMSETARSDTALELNAYSCNGTVTMYDGEGSLRWKQDYSFFDKQQASSPSSPHTYPSPQVSILVVADKRLIFAGANSYVAGLDPDTGDVRWKQGFEQGSGRGPVSFAAHEQYGDRIYVGSKGKVKALSHRSGEKLWSLSLPMMGYEAVTLLACPSGARLPGLSTRL